jgi:cyclic pyranopterin phosphate synthase
MSAELSHLDSAGNMRMVDVSEKKVSARIAKAACRILLKPETVRLIVQNRLQKGDVAACARAAGILAAKKTSDLIPLCHPLPISAVTLDVAVDESFGCEITCEAKVTAQTGAEMEALTGCLVAALTVYDMVKAVDRGAIITDAKLLSKSGGKSGAWVRDADL